VQPPRRGWVVALGTAVAVVVVDGAAAWYIRPEDQDPAGSITVHHTTAEYRQEVTAVCEGGEAYGSGDFDNYTIETWVDTVGGNSRGLATYPDGSSFEVTRVGKTEGQIYVEGDARGRLVGCRFGDETILLANPQDDAFNSLAFGEINLWTTNGTANFSSTEVQDSPETFEVEDVCEILDDPIGWLASEDLDFGSEGGFCVGQLDGRLVRIQVLTQLGTYFLSDTDHRESRLAQLNVFDESTRAVIQQAQRTSIEGVGDAVADMKVVEEESVAVTSGFFSTDGMTHLDGFVSVE
jgi:hypothetical protein